MKSAIIYTLISRDKVPLAHFTSVAGNFQPIAIDVVNSRDMSEKVDSSGNDYFRFYTYLFDNYVFLALVEKHYEKERAFAFLKQVQKQFFIRFPSEVRGQAIAYQLSTFEPFLKQLMRKYDEMEEEKYWTILSTEEQDEIKALQLCRQRSERIQIAFLKSKFENRAILRDSVQQVETNSEDEKCKCCCCIH